ncbi:heterogeneous nuclear ribonucleoprotein A0-like [Megalops cyprinoides]|uniref:heterogeneous nuclear ribonucleoprotein A0-like n=1 Tax=Megalops cyprinoides TaxID=118141 RepID=UPI001863AF01|nr:heterogeneous nuclear ribonucleoprotein A0-like [Megalops cyprinoides]
MSFFSKFVGGKANDYVDQAVDGAAGVAKVKVKEFLGGDTKKDEGKKEEGGGGGIAGFLSGKDDDKKEQGGGGIAGFFSGKDDEKKEEGGGGGIGGLLSFGKEEEEKGGSGGGGGGDLTDMLGDVAQEMAGDAVKGKATDAAVSFGKSLFS